MKKETTETQDSNVVNGERESLQKRDIFIVAISASAGGIETIHDFFDNAKPGSNVSYIIFQHPSSDDKSLLAELVSRYKQMRVFDAEHNMPVENNCIYVIPPRIVVSIADGRLQLTRKNSDGQEAEDKISADYNELVKANEELKKQNISLEEKAAEKTRELCASEERTRELGRINNALELSNHDLQQFASVVSHDLKEPLRKIHIFSNMLKDRYGETLDGGNDYIDRIISSSGRMTKLINDLLAFSRLSVNSLFQRVDLNVIVNELLQDLELAIQEKSAVIKVDKLPIVEAVPAQMRQLFQNIISNSLKFTRPEVIPVITITCETVDEEADGGVVKPGEYCRVTISDNGVGFNQQYADKIFTIFQRLHTKTAFEGTGIGLAICKKIVEKHNGHITAVSKIDVGTQFTILLPIEQEDAISS